MCDWQMPNGERTGAFCPTLFEQFVAPYPTQSQLLDVCTLGCTLSKIFNKIVKKSHQKIHQKSVIQGHAKLLKRCWTKGSCLLTIRLLPMTYFLLQFTLIFFLNCQEFFAAFLTNWNIGAQLRIWRILGGLAFWFFLNKKCLP